LKEEEEEKKLIKLIHVFIFSLSVWMKRKRWWVKKKQIEKFTIICWMVKSGVGER
jgi:hypothetical protein